VHYCPFNKVLVLYNVHSLYEYWSMHNATNFQHVLLVLHKIYSSHY